MKIFHEDILYRKYLKTFLISNMHCQELYLGNLECFAPLDSIFSN